MRNGREEEPADVCRWGARRAKVDGDNVGMEKRKNKDDKVGFGVLLNKKKFYVTTLTGNIATASSRKV